MFNFNTNINKASIGIDIGTQSVKIVEIQKKDKVYNISNYAIWDDDLDHSIQERNSNYESTSEYISEIILNLLKTSNIHTKECYICIPSYLAFSALIDIPIMSIEELTKAIPLEASKYIPTSVDEVQIDWIVLGNSLQPNSLEVLLIAVPNEVINKYLTIVNLLDLNIKGFELDIFSQIRSTNLNNVPTLIIDIGARSSMVSIVNEKQQLLITKSFDFGGNQITNQIMLFNEGIDISEAETLKKQNGLIGDDKSIVDIISQTYNNFILQNVDIVINDYYKKHTKNIEEVIVVGGTSRIRGIAEYTENILKQTDNRLINIKTFIGSPNSSIKITTDIQNMFVEKIWQDLSLSIGVALKKN